MWIPLWAILTASGVFVCYQASVVTLLAREVARPVPLVASGLLYLGSVLLSLRPTTGRLPKFSRRGALSITGAQVVTCVLCLSALSRDRPPEASLWYVSAVVLPLTLVAVRGHVLAAVATMLVVDVVTTVWSAGTPLGAAGAVSLVAVWNGALVVAAALRRILLRTARELATVQARQALSAADRAGTEVRRDELTRRTAELRRGAVGVLRRLAEGERGAVMRRDARLLEAELRDGIRGRRIVDDDPRVRDATRRARLRGVVVLLRDDAGPERGRAGVDEVLLADLRDRLVDALDAAQGGLVAGRLLPPGDAVAATVIIDAGADDVTLVEVPAPPGSLTGPNRPGT